MKMRKFVVVIMILFTVTTCTWADSDLKALILEEYRKNTYWNIEQILIGDYNQDGQEDAAMLIYDHTFDDEEFGIVGSGTPLDGWIRFVTLQDGQIQVLLDWREEIALSEGSRSLNGGIWEEDGFIHYAASGGTGVSWETGLTFGNISGQVGLVGYSSDVSTWTDYDRYTYNHLTSKYTHGYGRFPRDEESDFPEYQDVKVGYCFLVTETEGVTVDGQVESAWDQADWVQIKDDRTIWRSGWILGIH